MKTFRGWIALHSAVNLGQIAVGDHLWWLIANADLETRRTPVDELDGALCLEGCHSTVYIVWNHISTVEQASSHVLSIARVALHHLVVWLKTRHGDFLNGIGFMLCLGRRDDGCVSDEREVDARIRDEVGLKFSEIDIEGAIEAKRCSD